jgi:hypothetical protein
MGKTYPCITPELYQWIKKQKLFFVATAPLAADGHINLSPKGLDSFRVLDEHTAAYQDLTGSGIETIAHTQENGRIVIMFCALEGPPKIVRLHGRGEAFMPGEPEYNDLAAYFPDHPGTRAYIRIAIDRISDSCGYAVPLYEFKGERDVLDKWTTAKGPDGMIEYRNLKNSQSIDGLPGLDKFT